MTACIGGTITHTEDPTPGQEENSRKYQFNAWLRDDSSYQQCSVGLLHYGIGWQQAHPYR